MSDGERKGVQRFGMVIGLRPEKVEAYKALHAGPGVRHLLRQANIRNFAIYIRQLEDGRWLEFATYEYAGDDYAADIAWLAAQPVNQAWLALCDPMQIPLAGEKSWAAMDQIYYNG